MKTIHLASAILINKQNHFLTVRKKGSVYFMMAGGKIEKDELPEQTLIRELKEELNLEIATNTATLLGTYSTKAVNEEDTTVHAHIYLIDITDSEVKNCAEIEEIKWLTSENYKDTLLANLLTEFSLPIWLEMIEKK